MYRDIVDGSGKFNTPRYLFKYLDYHFHFELDPCDDGSAWLGLANNYSENGLERDWDKNTFVNPPYGSESEARWVEKAIAEHLRHRKTIFVLLPAKTESPYFHRIMTHACVAIFPQGRIDFVKNGKTMHGNNIGSVIFGLVDRGGYMISDDYKRVWDLSKTHERLDMPFMMTDEIDMFFPQKRTLIRNFAA